MLTLSFFGLSTLGSLFVGILGDQVGIAAALRAGGVAILATVLLLGARFPQLLRPVEPLSSR